MNHQSVLLNESIEFLNINPSGIYLDGTFGLGGHSRLILSRLSKDGRLIAIDRDLSAVNIGKKIFKRDKRFSIIHASFSQISRYVQKMKLMGLIDGILLDLGICESQLADTSRGFSFMRDGFLDMRMDVRVGQCAAQWLNIASQQNIEWVLKTFGEERFYKRIAKSIVLRRKLKPILSSLDLSKIISDSILYCGGNKRPKHSATRTFLAIRMYINDELEEIKQMLKDSLTLLSDHGRLVVISFNSLEDRIVKRFIYQHSHIFPVLPKLALTERQILKKYGHVRQFKNIVKLVPSVKEIQRNIRARSAVLRCAEKN